MLGSSNRLDNELLRRRKNLSPEQVEAFHVAQQEVYCQEESPSDLSMGVRKTIGSALVGAVVFGGFGLVAGTDIENFAIAAGAGAVLGISGYATTVVSSKKLEQN